MQDEEHGLLGFCSDMTDTGSGCASVIASYISDCEIQVKVDKWYYRIEHEEFAILPEDFSITLTHYSIPTDEDSEEFMQFIYSDKSPSPSYRNSTSETLTCFSDSGEWNDIRLGRIIEEDGTFPTWYHEYDGLNDCLEGIFGFGECGADNIMTSNVFVFPLSEGGFRLRYIYTELSGLVMGDHGEYGILELSKNHGFDAGGYMSMEQWACVWYPEKDTQVILAGKDFSSFYKKNYIPYLVRVAQANEWEDGFEKKTVEQWEDSRYYDYLEIVMCKKLIFTAQEVIAGRFDGDPYKVSERVEKKYKPDAVKLDHYYPEKDPNAYILHADLDMCGEEEKIAIRPYRWDGAEDMPLDSVQVMIDGQIYFNLYGETVQAKIFIVDIDKSDLLKEFAIVFTQEEGYSYIRLFRYNEGSVTEIGAICGKLDNEFPGIGKVAEFPGDGTIVVYVPKDDGFVREIVYPEEKHGTWIGSTYFY